MISGRDHELDCTYIPYVLYIRYTCAHPTIMFHTASTTKTPSSPPPTNWIWSHNALSDKTLFGAQQPRLAPARCVRTDGDFHTFAASTYGRSKFNFGFIWYVATYLTTAEIPMVVIVEFQMKDYRFCSLWSCYHWDRVTPSSSGAVEDRLRSRLDDSHLLGLRNV
jgi:hypothetical protein